MSGLKEPASRHPIIAEESDFVIRQNEDFEREITCSGQDFTGFTFEGKIAQYPGWESVHDFTPVITNAPGSDGKFTVTIENTVTDTFDFGREPYYYEIFSISGSGIRGQVLSGRVRLVPKI